ncbi:DUF2341 domain-containing protein [Luteolibacter flavescens]|uniref:DUF2341 domain-containing protein n=1 Tax=Luteolibacter flavescens TaxID=1859460 RepID=A0ABT3FUL7_9BACT|nr:DUF2341 domain-containing protein [Luteolibacter flavescens]MCW1887285.1 DUF2341 domain-containing protein [Luteolibacter flavescens]
MIARHVIASLALLAPLHAAEGWWNKEWTQRQKININTGSDAANLSGAVENAAVLVRLHDGNFQFANAAPDGSDLRFVTDDGTVLPHEIEKYDGLVDGGFIWVKVPSLAAGGATTVNLYYGSANPAGVPVAKPGDVHDAALVWHFADRGGAPADATANGNDGSIPLTSSEGAIIGSGARLLGAEPVTVAASPSLDFSNGFTWSAWVKPTALQAGAEIFRRGDFRIVLDNGVPVVAAGGERSTPGQPVTAGSWTHLAATAEAGKVSLFVNGEPVSQLAATLPVLDGALTIGGTEAGSRFVGEIDELQISSAPRSADWVKFTAISQGGTDAGQRTVSLGEVEGGEGGGGHSEALEHVMLFGDIAKNMMFDGWIAIGVCVVMIVIGWTVAFKKFTYLNKVQKGTRAFLQQWEELSSDLTALDHNDPAGISSLEQTADDRTRGLIRQSPLYQIYHIGSKEIRHRLDRDKDRTKGLSGRSIQAVRAALDRGLVRETHRLTKGLVYLTISIAGGPYVGLLGTVVGVMITFAIISKSGEVDVNSIAPGIASALLATVAGLVVAIPALFIYSYLNSRIKETTSDMHVFIDEFVAKMAEFYPPAGESSPYAPNNDKVA